MNKTKFTSLTASLVLATIFTFSCSSDEGSGVSSPSVGDGGSSSSEGTQGSISSSSDGGGGLSSSTPGGSSSSSGSEGGSKITKSKISGVSQKGPFVEGSTAILDELDDVFTQTGRSFRDMIADDKGSFEIRGVELISPYARLEAYGYYRNEVTGEVSKGQITLIAIADIREKDNVNVNLLTHLEYYRVLNLVEGGKSVAEAKKQAQKEILAVFGINGDFENSEDMTIFGTTDGDAALLAISVLLQGNLGEGEFSQRLTNFAQSVKGSGKWENETAKAAIADWAYTANLAGIRSNITGWGLSSEVPDFEKYVTNYWATAYGLGGCSSANEGEVKKNNRNFYHICKDGIWQEELNYKKIYCSENVCKYFTDTRDNQRYTYVVIGEQTWMAENLNYNVSGSKCYNNLDSNCYKYGRLYTWSQAKSACPKDWHLPTKEEWEVLGSDAKKLKTASGWNDYDGTSGNGTDEYEFSALPGGYFDGYASNFGGVGGDAFWWGDDDETYGNAYYREIGYCLWEIGECVTWSRKEKFYLYSVRCLQD